MTMTPEEHLALANINPELKELMKNSPPQIRIDASSDIHALRAASLSQKLQITSANTAAGESRYVETDLQIPVRDGSTIAVRIHKPKAPPKDGSPIFVVYHGGGFCFGGLDNEVLLCRKWTELGGVAVNVDYRLAPEHVFPVPVEDAYDALKWTADHFEELGGNPKKGFLVGGISAGGNFAAVVSHLARDDKLSPPLTGAYLSIPACMSPELVPAKYKEVYLSREQNQDAPILGSSAMEFFQSHYKSDELSPLRSPIAFPSHESLPPSYFQICGMDPLRDEALIYEEILRAENGVKTKVHTYPGLPHGFWSWFPEAQFTKDFREDCVEGMKWLLEQSA